MDHGQYKGHDKRGADPDHPWVLPERPMLVVHRVLPLQPTLLPRPDDPLDCSARLAVAREAPNYAGDGSHSPTLLRQSLANLANGARLMLEMRSCTLPTL